MFLNFVFSYRQGATYIKCCKACAASESHRLQYKKYTFKLLNIRDRGIMAILLDSLVNNDVIHLFSYTTSQFPTALKCCKACAASESHRFQYKKYTFKLLNIRDRGIMAILLDSLVNNDVIHLFSYTTSQFPTAITSLLLFNRKKCSLFHFFKNVRILAKTPSF